MAKTACARGWDPLELLVRVRAEEVTGRETHGGENHTRAARFPQVKILDDVDFAHQRSASRSQIAHLHQLDFVREAHNVIFFRLTGHRQDTPLDRYRQWDRLANRYGYTNTWVEMLVRARRDEWTDAGVFDVLVSEALAAYDRVAGLDLSDVSVDGSGHKAPCGGEGTGKPL